MILRYSGRDLSLYETVKGGKVRCGKPHRHLQAELAAPHGRHPSGPQESLGVSVRHRRPGRELAQISLRDQPTCSRCTHAVAQDHLVSAPAAQLSQPLRKRAGNNEGCSWGISLNRGQSQHCTVSLALALRGPEMPTPSQSYRQGH